MDRVPPDPLTETSRASEPLAPAGPARLRLSDLSVIRPHQWVKNTLLFLPMVLAHEVHKLKQWLTLMLAFAAFCLLASSVYVVNDLLDVTADRHHPSKRHRPFASGRLPLLYGPLIVLGLVLPAIAACLFLPHAFSVVLAGYLVLSTAYSVYLKSRLLVDVMVLSTLYTLRLLGGGAAAGVQVSPWLLAFSMFLFLSLAFVKRYTELRQVESRGEAMARGRGYEVHDLRIIEAVGPASGYMAVMVLALYIADAAAKLYPTPIFLWLVCPLLLYWITRVWFFARRGQVSDDPILFAATDRISWYCLILVGILAILAAMHLPGGDLISIR